MTEPDVFEERFAGAYRRLLDEAPTTVDAAAVARAVASHGTAGQGAWARPTLATRRVLAWVALVALLLVALGGSVLLVGSLVHPSPAVPLRPTGVDLLTPDVGAYTDPVVDGRGAVWARDDGGRLLRLDPATGSVQVWTVADDAAFASSDITGARAGGVWLASGRTLRLFDGSAFREVATAPAEISFVAEARDGSVWAASSEGLVFRWSGTEWRTLDPIPESGVWIRVLAVDAAGWPWLGGANGEPVNGRQPGWVARFDGVRWTVFGVSDSGALDSLVLAMAAAPAGAMWVATMSGVVRYEGGAWADQTPGPAGAGQPAGVVAGPDGEIWAATATEGPGSLSVVWRFDGRDWLRYGAASPVSAAQSWGLTPVPMAPTPGGVYIANGRSLIRLTSGGTERVWPPADAEPAHPTILLAVSRDELWAVSDGGLWHCRGGVWTREAEPSLPSAMVLARDGTIWAAGESGVAYRRGGAWALADPTPAVAVAVNTDGNPWIVGRGGPDSAPVWTMRQEGSAWIREPLPQAPLAVLDSATIAVDRAGRPWVGSQGDADSKFAGVARFDGQSWQSLAAMKAPDTYGTVVAGGDADGAVWTYGPLGGVSRFDGTRWTMIVLPRDAGPPSIAADGSAWAMRPDGPARYDAGSWTYPYDPGTWTYPFESVLRPGTATWQPQSTIVVAPDGTVFAQLGTAIVRFGVPAATP